LNSVGTIEPTSTLAQVLAMVHTFLGVLLVTIMLGLFFSIQAAKSSSEFDRIVDSLERKAIEVHNSMLTKYRLSSLQDVVDELNRMKNSTLILFIGFRDWNTKKLNDQ
jgi:hypothetical protein